MSKLKSAWDAVNELRGVLLLSEQAKHHTHLASCRLGAGVYSVYASDVRSDLVVCTIAEFNNLVEEMFANFGKCSHLDYASYQLSDKTLLEKETRLHDLVGKEMELSEWDKVGGAFDAGVTYLLVDGSTDVFITGKQYTANGVGVVDEYDRGNKTSVCKTGDCILKLISLQPTPTETPEEKEALDKIFVADSAPKPIKTVWDAVNELRGDLAGATYVNTHKVNYKTIDVYLHVVLTNDYASQPIGSFVIYSANESARGDVRFICTIEEFNKLVEEMTLGLDVNPVNHGHYLNYVDADKTLLEKETKPDYTSLEFWKDAPEGATHHCGAHNGFSDVWIKDLKEDSYSFRVVGSLYASDEWRHTNTILRDELKYLTPRPQPKSVRPVYTQEMHDNGVKPSVGMQCTIDFIGGNIFIGAELTYLSKTLGCFKCKEGVERSFDVSCINFYPITPPTPLIDGKAYQFDNGDDKGLYGVYDRLHGLFHNRDSYVVRDCTNIKLLTLKWE